MLGRNSYLALVMLLALGGCSDGDGGLEVGEADAASMHACAHVDHAGTPVTAAADEAGAADVVLAGQMPPYTVTLPASGVGYITVDVTVPHFDWGLFVREGVTATLLDGPPLSRAALAGACVEERLMDYRVHMHEAGLFVVRLENTGGGEEWLSFRQLTSDHVDGGAGSDASHMHGDAGHPDASADASDDAGHMHSDAGHSDAGHSDASADADHGDASMDAAHVHGDAAHGDAG